MKQVTIALEDELYETASAQAARSQKTLGEFLRDVFFSGLHSGDKAMRDGPAALKALWELADARPVTSGSAGPLNRDDLYERGLSGHYAPVTRSVISTPASWPLRWRWDAPPCIRRT